MTELKVYHCNEWHNEYTEFYMKSEADEYITELKAENKRLKKCEIWMKQHFYCEEVIACESAKNRRLKRALWLARAERAHLKVLEYWPDYCHNAHCRIAEQKWDKVERKCRAMAEKFK